MIFQFPNPNLFLTGFTAMCVDHIPAPSVNAKRKVEHIYTGPLDTELSESMLQCDPEVGASETLKKLD
jgi:hypothetical protein